MTSFEIECVSQAMNDYLRKCDAEENIHPFNKKKARWYPYRSLEEVKIKLKEEDPNQREEGNKNANETSNEIPNKMLYIPIMEYEAVTEILKSLPFFFVFSDNSFAVKGFPIDKTRKFFV